MTTVSAKKPAKQPLRHESKLVELQNLMEEKAHQIEGIGLVPAKRLLDFIENEQLALAMSRIAQDHDPVGQAADAGAFRILEKLADVMRDVIARRAAEAAEGDSDE